MRRHARKIDNISTPTLIFVRHQSIFRAKQIFLINTTYLQNNMNFFNQE